LAKLVFITFSYILFTDIIIILYAKITNQLSDIQKIGPWHTLYIGLGWENNPFDIIFLDECAFIATKKINPDVVYESREYFNILKDLYLELFKSNIGYFFLTYSKKLLMCLINSIYLFMTYDRGFVFFIYFIIFFIVIRLLNNTKNVIYEIMKKYCLLFIFCLILIFGSLLYPMMATPTYPYLMGITAGYEMLMFFMLTALLEIFINIVSKVEMYYEANSP
jgi:hypothetical protein